MFEFYIAVIGCFDMILESSSFVRIEAFAAHLIEELKKYSDYPMTGTIVMIYIEDINENYVIIPMDIGYLLAWVSDDSD